MNVTNAGPVQKCSRCGQDWIQAHYCPELNAPYHGGAKVAVALTEADIRRIVREELARDLAERRERSRVEAMIEFYDCANYRGPLQAKSDGGNFFWRVACDFEEEVWSEIPEYLWVSLNKYHEESPKQHKPRPVEDDWD